MRMFSLDDLESLSAGSKKLICDMLYSPPAEDYDYFLILGEIEDRLAENRITADEVVISEGNAEGLTLQEAFQLASHTNRLVMDQSSKCHK